MGHVALEVPLGLLAVVRRGQGGDAAHPRVEPLGDALDHAALAGGVAPLEQHDEPVSGAHDPVLQLDQLALELKQLAEVVAALLLLQVGQRDFAAVRIEGRSSSSSSSSSS